MAETFGKIGYPAAKLRYLVNRADSPAGLDPAELVARLGREPEYRVRSDGKVVVSASNRGQAFVVTDPEALVSRDVIEIARRLAPARAESERPTAAAAR
jgi:Flp pilus assembly CpaE family ATPase